MHSLLPCTKGNVAIIFGLTVIPVFGIVGAALDYGRAYSVRNYMQTKIDTVALNSAVAGTEQSHAGAMSALQSEISERFGATGVITALDLTGDWAGTDFVVEATASVTTAMVHILPGIGNTIDVSVRAVARPSEVTTTYEPPIATQLDPDAGDYNQVYAYCFQPDGMGPPHSRRKQMTLIADNEDNTYNDWPLCGENETLSFRLRNVRHAKAHPELWDNRNRPPYRAEYDYFTDTEIVNGVAMHTIRREVAWIPSHWQQYHDPGRFQDGTFDVLETIRCDSEQECKGESEGGIIPEGANREPQVEDRGCEPGKYMYFGWEDRPPGQAGPSSDWTDPAWTDRSYDDIRIVMKCPETGSLGERTVRLIQ